MRLFNVVERDAFGKVVDTFLQDRPFMDCLTVAKNVVEHRQRAMGLQVTNSSDTVVMDVTSDHATVRRVWWNSVVVAEVEVVAVGE